MKDVSEYTIVLGYTSGNLTTMVNNQIQLGWQPIGSPFTDDQLIGQAMVRYEEDVYTGPR